MKLNAKQALMVVAMFGLAGVGAIESQVPRDDYFLFGSVEEAESWKRYHEERLAYITENWQKEGIPADVLPRVQADKDKFEEYLVDKKFTDRKGGPIKEPPKGIVGPASEVLSQALEPAKAYAALLFGHEGIEDGTTNAFDSAGDVFGATSLTVDSGSNMTGTYSLLLESAGPGNGSSVAYVDEPSSITEGYVSFTIKLASGFAFGASSYTGIFQWRDTSNNTRIRINLEDYGSPRLIISGDVSYTNTGISLTPGTQEKVEMRVVKNTSTGVVQLWLDNDTEGSPDYSATGINTGAAGFQRTTWGVTFAPEGHSDFYQDDFCVGDAFIGATCVADTGSRRILFSIPQ